MTDRIDENPPMSIPEQAAEWLLRWHCGDLSIADRYEYLQWLKTSPVHIAEMLRMCRLYSWLDSAKLKLFVTNEDTFSNVVELAPRERETKKVRGGNRASVWTVSIAAGISALGLAALVGLAGKVMWFDHTFQTHAGEWRTMPLSDGSSISAAPFTRLHHDFGDDQRFISLERGKAVFRVAKDPSRPFMVEAGGVVITATGTQFGVESGDETVTVTMREGTVIVTPAADSEATFASVHLAADDQLTLSASGEPKVVHTDAEQELEWEHGLLKFVDGDTIGDAVAQFNDFNDLKIMVDERTGARPMRGRFDAIDPLSFADTVGLTVNASVVRESPELIRIKATEHRR
ncbi:MAG TPA: FecR domain-containing protein [Steroidobacteraceae bacterium]|nr:FecR domain-containing protein [Steroidobacteraceae bacterium]